MISFRETSEAPQLSPVQAITETIFRAQGGLQKALGLEFRPQQSSMANATARAFAANTPLLFEAGTGTGKSLAYLVPGIIQSILEKRPFLVSSHTIALQEQIRNKDLEICRSLFEKIPELAPFKDFKVAMLVGRRNYLCGHRLTQAINGKTDLFGSEEQDDLIRISNWALTTKEGLLEELTPPPSREVWEWVNADSSSCNRRNCSPETCFFRKAQKRRAESNVIILNHSLLFSLISAGLSPGEKARGILYPNDFLILDEAHRIPDIATDHFGLGISSYGLGRALKMLYNPTLKKPRGFLVKHGDRQSQVAVTKAIVSAEEFFNDIKRRYLDKSSLTRLFEENWTDPALNRPLGYVADRLNILSQEMKDESIKQELKDHSTRIKSFITGINESLELKQKDHVYWLERGGRKKPIITLRSAPLDVAPYLEETLFQRGTSTVLTSATLSIGGTMETFQKRAGATEEEASIESSPFDYERNMSIFVATDAPEPTRESGRQDLDFIADMIGFCANRVEGGTLALFTSYTDMHQVALQLENSPHNHRRQILSQGQEYSRSDLKRLFLDAGNAILLGTDSFWTGFDVPGSALSQVILTRLPFENPGHPLSEARNEWIRKNGGNPFSERIIPDAVIKFRQGIGRLIRNQTDRGVVTVLDSRIVHKLYGRDFLMGLPKERFETMNRQNRDEVFPFFKI